MSDPDAVAARARVEAVLERLKRVGLQVVVVAPPDETRRVARDRARDAAITAGRGALLDEAVAAARDVAIRAFAGSAFTGTWAATEMAASVASAGDRVAAAAAFEEAATAAVVEDLVDGDTLAVLRSTSEELVELSGIPQPGSLSALGSPGGAIRSPLQLALVAGLGIIVALVGFAVGGAQGVIVLLLALAIVASLVRRLMQPRS